MGVGKIVYKYIIAPLHNVQYVMCAFPLKQLPYVYAYKA